MNASDKTSIKRVAIVYHSGYGNTEQLASAIERGAQSIDGVQVERLRLTGEQIQSGRWQDQDIMNRLNDADAIVFGSPTYMGSVSGVFKCFADATAPTWMNHGWQDKLAAGFTTSSHPSGDKVMTLHYLVTLAAQLRMVWLGPVAQASHMTGGSEGLDQWGYYLGVGGLGTVQPGFGSGPTPGDLLTAEKYGQRIARATLHWKPAP